MLDSEKEWGEEVEENGIDAGLAAVSSDLYSPSSAVLLECASAVEPSAPEGGLASRARTFSPLPLLAEINASSSSAPRTDSISATKAAIAGSVVEGMGTPLPPHSAADGRTHALAGEAPPVSSHTSSAPSASIAEVQEGAIYPKPVGSQRASSRSVMASSRARRAAFAAPCSAANRSNEEVAA